MEGTAPNATHETTMKPGAARRVVTAAVLLALVVSAFESTVVTSAMPTITADLGGRSLYAWVFSAFLMASTVGVLLCGRLADHIGRRPVFTGGMVTFLIGSALCGRAHSMEALIASRVLQGFGAGVLQPVTTTISADIYTLRERANVQALITGTWGSANVLGPLIGGWIVMHASWRWVFLVNVPVGVIAVVLLLTAYRDPQRRAGIEAFEPVGPLLGGSALALILLAVAPGAVSGDLRLWLAVGAAILIGAFAVRERGSASPTFPERLMTDRTVIAGLLGGLFIGGLLYTASAYLPLFVIEARHRSPLAAGFAVVPVLVGWAVGAPIGVRILLRHGMRASLGGGLVVAFSGALLLAGAVSFALPLGLVASAAALLGLGLGSAGSTSTLAPQTRVGWHDRAHVTSMLFASRMLGGSLAVALLAGAHGHFAEQFGLVAVLAGSAALVLLSAAPTGEVRRAEPAAELQAA
jgi:EmrB/QacA subfamily drug resistance transporter